MERKDLYQQNNLTSVQCFNITGTILLLFFAVCSSSTTVIADSSGVSLNIAIQQNSPSAGSTPATACGTMILFYVLPEDLPLASVCDGGARSWACITAVYCAGGVPGGTRSRARAASGDRRGRAVNLDARWHTLRRIIVPKPSPGRCWCWSNYLVAMFKDTPLLSAITVVELLQTAKIAGAESFRYVEAFTLVGLFFWY